MKHEGDGNKNVWLFLLFFLSNDLVLRFDFMYSESHSCARLYYITQRKDKCNTQIKENEIIKHILSRENNKFIT